MTGPVIGALLFYLLIMVLGIFIVFQTSSQLVRDEKFRLDHSNYHRTQGLLQHESRYHQPKNVQEITLLAELPAKLKPEPTDGRRLIFIGDVHGAHDELVRLLDKVGFNKSQGM
jgi:hypothetical protein